MKLRTIFLVVSGMVFSANTIPRFTEAQLTEKADLVATIRVTKTQISVGKKRCFAGVVLGLAKGHAPGRIIICDNLIAELTPPMPTKGKFYTMYLLRTGRQTFVPVGYDAFRPPK